jgi:hypothetical protein
MSGKITRRRLSAKRKGKTDWNRADSQTGRALKRSMTADADVSGLDASAPCHAGVQGIHSPAARSRCPCQVQAAGRGYLTRMNAVLRTYMEAHTTR